MIYGMIILGRCSVRRVTVTLPDDVVDEIDRWEKNRSSFVLTAALRELELRRRRELERSLSNPHPEAGRVAEQGIEDWSVALPDEDADLLDPSAGKPVRWVEGLGWEASD
jgi:hypothetical protein